MSRTRSTPLDDPLEAIVAALESGGARTAGRLATDLGVAYSTLTPRLRQLEADSRIERIKDPTTRQTIWQAVAAAPANPSADAVASSGLTAAPAPGSQTAVQPTDPGDPAPSAASSGAVDPDAAAPPTARRPKGSVPEAILAAMRAAPDQTFKVSQLVKALGGTSAGAIANAATKLVVSGELVQVCEQPATYQAA